MDGPPKSSPVPLLKAIAVGFVVLFFSYAIVYRPDRPVPHLVPGAASEPTFVVQLIRPRAGLPLGGLVPPEVVGLDAFVGFHSVGPEVRFGRVDSTLIEFSAGDERVALHLGPDGDVRPETEVLFEIEFQDEVILARARPAAPPVGSVELVELDDGETLAGSFEIELPHCEHAVFGYSLDWPPQPLILRGSFDRLRIRGPARED